jgi:hypothetical protein
MVDSHSEDPPEGGFMQRVVSGISNLGSGRRPQQPNAATRRSASFTSHVTIPNISFSSGRSRLSRRPNPDAPRVETLQSRPLAPLDDVPSHPNVETQRGHYESNFSLLPSISGTIQRQVQSLEAGLDAALADKLPSLADHLIPPPTHILFPETAIAFE